MHYTMYSPQVNSTQTSLATDIDSTQISLEVIDGSRLPNAPNIVVIGDGDNAETILYKQKSGNILLEITRGFQGEASTWNSGTNIARYFTAYDQEAVQGNLISLIDEGNIEVTKSKHVFNVPEDCVDGFTSSREIKGLSLYNFDSKGQAELTLQTTIDANATDLSSMVNEGDKILKVAEVYQASGEIVKLKFQDSEVAFTPLASDNKWVRVAYVGTYSQSATNKSVGFFADNVSSSKVKNQLTINLTTHNLAGYDINKLLQIISGYFSELESVSNLAIHSYGKNLFNINDNFNFTVDESDTTPLIVRDQDSLIIKSNTSSHSGRGIKTILKPNTEYTLSFNLVNCNLDITVYDSVDFSLANKDQNELIKLSNIEVGNKREVSFTTNNKKEYFITFNNSTSPSNGGAKISDIQLEEGSAVTEYTSFKSSAKIEVADTLKSLPNGVSDRYFVQNGKVYFEKRISDIFTIQSDNVVHLDITGTNVDIAIAKLTDFNNESVWSNNAINSDIVVFGKHQTIYEDSNDKKNMYFTSNNTESPYLGNYIGFIVAKGTYTDLNAAKTAINGTKVICKLKKSVISETLTNNSWIAFNKGTVVCQDSIIAPIITAKYCKNLATQRQQNVETLNKSIAQISTQVNKVLASNAKGVSNFASSSNEVTIGHGLGITPSYVTITPSENPNGLLGEVWVRKDENNIYVGNSGDATTSFEWLAYK